MTNLRDASVMLRVIKASSGEAIKLLEKRHLESDLKLDKTHGGGYAPSAEVLAHRERSRQKMEVDALGNKLWADQYASEHDGDKGVWVTYRNNSDKRIWQAQMDTFASLLKDLGLKLNGNTVSYDQKRVKAAKAAHDAYIKLLASKGSKGAKKMMEGTVMASAKVSAAKDTGSTSKDKSRKGALEEAMATCALLRENVDLTLFPDVESACKAVDSLSATHNALSEAIVRLKACKPRTEEAKMAQDQLNALRNKVDTMIKPLSATVDTMKRLVLAAAALEEKFSSLSEQVDAMKDELKSSKDQLSSISKAVETTAQM